ncbi:MAG: phytoene desaturase [Bacteroidetes bacterium]|nr:MAG: phytoene desaturase [Bacteroidota bacterium]
MNSSPEAVVIGSGFSGLASACTLAAKGFAVTILEKNSSGGGRARKFEQDGFVFDMGPSWYWMPDVFESFFNRFGKSVRDYYELVRLDPSYRIFFAENKRFDVPASVQQLGEAFEAMETGSAKKLRLFLEEARYKYEIGINSLVYKPGLSLREFADRKLIGGIFRLDVFRSMHAHIRSYFSHPQIVQMLEFPVLFLGETPKNTPALYSLMNYADIALGTWYPQGGMYKIVDGMRQLAESLGVKIEYGAQVEKIDVQNGRATGVRCNGGFREADIVIGAADYHHVEQNLLDPEWRRYDESYWQSRRLAPSSLIFYLGINKRLKNLLHHNLFFDESFDAHAAEIYDRPAWPERPLFYVCCPSVTDASVAPAGCENLFVLIPVATGLEDEDATREKYFELIIRRLERITGQEIREHIVYKKSYAHRDFISDYNAYKGNAYGLANTLKQTAMFKPSLKSKKVSNLYYAGQLTVPGPGVPPSIISGIVAGELAAKENLQKSSVTT